MTDNKKITLLLYGDSRFDESKNKFTLQSSMKYIKSNWKILRTPFRVKFYQFPKAVINIFFDLSWFLQFLQLNFAFFGFCFCFFCQHISFPTVIHTIAIGGTVESILSCIYFCEHITIGKIIKELESTFKYQK